ncbi:hypothetical protein [Actinoplanes sp. TFC3]|uniref:hypothetical protein n=1 Tax=Actinoplanes sp. TFC3 TaxID=1710355 RepID=UPI000832AD12|nr:hypothetical protein [Actinoplanes sp. TFC3]
MYELALVPLVDGTSPRLMTSALPDSPVVAAPAPGRIRRLAAGALHRIATRLDGPGRPPVPRRRPANHWGDARV